LSGERLELPAITIPGTSYQEVDLRILLANNLPQFEEGSLQVSHQGIRLQLGAQFKIFKDGKRLVAAFAAVRYEIHHFKHDRRARDGNRRS
jgi:hypothetical protein